MLGVGDLDELGREHDVVELAGLLALGRLLLGRDDDVPAPADSVVRPQREAVDLTELLDELLDVLDGLRVGPARYVEQA